MKKTLYTLPLLVPMAHANLPDEINYPPYQVQYERLSAEVDVVTQNLEATEAQLQNRYNREAQVISDIEALKDRNYQLQTDIQGLTQERQDLTLQADDLTNIVNDLERRVSRASDQL